MKLLLIAPASGHWKNVGKSKLFNGKTFRFSMLSLLHVAAETPQGNSIRIIDEQIENIPWNENFDLVGITSMTAAAPRAYEIADLFRQKRVPVVMGGMHPTFCTSEALQHCDAVVVGEAEGLWPQLLHDIQQGQLRQIYRHDQPFDLKEIKTLPRHLLKGSRYATQYAVQATRGCSHQCAFCSVSAFNKNQHRKRPIPSVVNEIAQIPKQSFIFVDDNLTADTEYATALFHELIPLNKRWITQSTLSIAEHPALIHLMAQAGCIGIFAGLETFSESNLNKVNKSCNRINRYRESIELLHQAGIGIEAGIVVGFDNDDVFVFENTLKMLDELQIDMAQISIFTPLPGTSQFEAMKDRIIDYNWAHYDFHHAVFQPARMSAESLQAGHDWLTREFYKPWRMTRRLSRFSTPLSTLPLSLALNLAYYGRVTRWHIRGWNPADSSRHSVFLESGYSGLSG